MKVPEIVEDSLNEVEILVLPFYISSYGGTATAWLSAVLSSHPSIVYFHGTRSVPPHKTDHGLIGSVSPNTFVDALAEYSRACRGKKVFGALHGYHGISAKEANENRNGIFCSIIRHPIARIHRLALIHIRFALEMKTSDIFGEILVLESCNSSESKDKLDLASRRFYNIAKQSFQFNIECVEHSKKENIFQMETLTTQDSELERLIGTISCGKLSFDSHQLNDAMSISDQNRRGSKTKGLLSMDRWPETIWNAYKTAIEEIGKERIIDFYGQFGYEDVVS